MLSFWKQGFSHGLAGQSLGQFRSDGGMGGNGTAHGWVVVYFFNKMKNLSFSL